MTEGLIDQEGRTPGRVLSALARSASLRVQHDAQCLTVRGERYALANPLIDDLATVLAVPREEVERAITEGEVSGVLRTVRDDVGVLVAVRADPL
jgi:hypothetical protein